jgi:hypothetical protein
MPASAKSLPLPLLISAPPSPSPTDQHRPGPESPPIAPSIGQGYCSSSISPKNGATAKTPSVDAACRILLHGGACAARLPRRGHRRPARSHALVSCSLAPLTLRKPLTRWKPWCQNCGTLNQCDSWVGLGYSQLGVNRLTNSTQGSERGRSTTLYWIRVN